MSGQEPAEDGDTPGASASAGAPALRLILTPAAPYDDGRGLVRLPHAALRSLGLRPGDTVALCPVAPDATGSVTHARAMPGRGAAGEVATDGTVAANAGARWGEEVEIRSAPLPALASATLRLDSPGRPDSAAVREALRDMALTEGDSLDVTATTPPTRLRLRVERLAPVRAGLATADTALDMVATTQDRPAYPGVAGLRRQIAALHETVELPLRRPDLFRRLGLAPPRGALFTGPPGSGKTLLARALADRTEAAFYHLAGPEIVSKHYGESERALRDVFEAAQRAAPAIVFIDEIDAIAPRRDALSGEKQVERRIVGQLLTLLDGLEARDRVVVLAATNLPDTLDPALRRPGRFEREIAFAAPDPAERAEILALHLADAPLAPDVDLAGLSERCHGHVGADLAALAREAGLAALARAARAAGGAEHIDAGALAVTAADLEAGRACVRPSALRADGADPAPPRWRDVGGLDAAKRMLTEAVIWPMTQSGALHRLGLGLPRGILLEGPPGTGKTLLVRALAAESGMNFLPLSAARLLSQFLGETERELDAAFRRARASAPTLLFIDEIDTLAPHRGRADAAIDRVVAHLLTEMDGLARNDRVVVVGATNRPDAIDPALVRPGRFDLVIPIRPPDAASRREVLEVHLRGRPLAPDVDIGAIAAAAHGATPAAIATLVSDAARSAFSRHVAAPEGMRDAPQITQRDLRDACARLLRRQRAGTGQDTRRERQTG